MTHQADIAALQQRVATLEERVMGQARDYGELRGDLRSLSNRVWAILALLCGNLIALLLPTFRAAAR